ncbi:hypothetical protein Tco_0739211 [Tanacetum coccineum]
MNDSRSCDQLAQDLARENNNECSSGEEEEGEQQSGDDYSEEEEIFSFQFSSIDGLNAMLENGPWFIHSNSLIMKKCEVGLSVIATKIITLLMLNSYTSDMCIQSWVLSSYARALIEVRADVELKDNIVVVMSKFVRKGFYTCNVHVEYEWKPLSQTPRGLLVVPKVGFKLVKQVYRQVSKKNNVNTSDNKNKDMEPTLEFSNSNPFDVLNLFENDVDLGTNGRTSNKASKKANSSGSLWNVILVDDEGNPLTKVDSSGDHDSEDEVASVDNGMANFLTLKKVGYGTYSLLQQWKESYVNGDYDLEPMMLISMKVTHGNEFGGTKCTSIKSLNLPDSNNGVVEIRKLMSSMSYSL